MIKRKEISKNSRSRRAAPGLVMAAVVGVGPAALAAPGDLDTTFDTDGKVTTDFVGTDDSAEGVVLQPDGKIVAAGVAHNVGGTSGTKNDFALARYTDDGTLDAGFDGDGKVTTDFQLVTDGTATFSDDGQALVLQTDGKLVAAGVAGHNASLTGNDFALARYSDVDGSLDTGFGTGGKVSTHIRSVELAEGVALLSDGRIVAAGSIVLTDFALALYLPGGDLDTTFRGSISDIPGTAVTDFGSSSDSARAVVVQSGDLIIAAGDANGDFALARYNDDGSLDPGFSGDGKVTTAFDGGGSNSDGARAVIVQPDGKIIAAGFSDRGSGNNDFALARYNTNGSLDDGGLSDITGGDQFGNGGKVITGIGGADFANALVLQPDGKIIVVGDGGGDFAVVRYDANGTPDPTFGGGDGIVTTDFGASDGAHAAVFQSDPDGDKLIVAGSTFANGTNADFALARYKLADDPNEPPVANNDTFSTNEDTSLTVGAAPGVLANDTDANNNDTLTATIVTSPTHHTGTFNLNADGSFTYTPTENFSGSDSFTYKANDGTEDSNVATVTITVTAVDDPATVAVSSPPPFGSCPADNRGTINLTVTDADGGSNPLSATSTNLQVVPAANLVFSGSGANRTLTITAGKKTGSSTITVTGGSTPLQIGFQSGGAGKDRLNGTNLSDLLLGGAGNDTLNGAGSAPDVLCGGSGTDTFIAGPEDTFIQ